MTKYAKHTITIYSPFLNDRELSQLAREAEEGEAICTDYAKTFVAADELPEEAREFFGDADEED